MTKSIKKQVVMIKHDTKTVEVKPVKKGVFCIKIIQGFENTDKKNKVNPTILYEKNHKAQDVNEAFVLGNEIKLKIEQNEKKATLKKTKKQ